MSLNRNRPSSVGQVTQEVSRASEPVNSTSSQQGLSPLRFQLNMIGGIALAEVVAMVVIYFFTDLPYYLETLLDAAIMVVLITPIVYLFSLRPLLRQIEKRKQSEDRLQRVNRALSVLNECNKVLVRAENEPELLQQMCEIIVKAGEYPHQPPGGRDAFHQCTDRRIPSR